MRWTDVLEPPTTSDHATFDPIGRERTRQWSAGGRPYQFIGGLREQTERATRVAILVPKVREPGLLARIKFFEEI